MIKRRTARDFKFIRLLGEGSFSSVYLAVDANIPAIPANHNNSNSINNDQRQLNNLVAAAAEKSKTGDGESLNNNHETGDTTVATQTKSNAINNTLTTKRLRKYAIKVCQKSHIKRQGKQVAIMREKEIMNILNQSQCKHFIRLYCTFQDMERLFFVMSYAENGELLTYMLEHPLSMETVRKFTLQLVSALEHLHKLHIVHRDLKPENILLNELLDLLISDFGSAQIYNTAPQTAPEPAARSITPPAPTQASKPSPSPLPTSVKHQPSSLTNKSTAATQSTALTIPYATNNNARTVNATSDRRNSFVGTAQYVSPEMLRNREASNKSDLWAMGVIIYQMITNVMPFDAPNEYLIYKKIQGLDYNFPDDFDENARDLVKSLIKLDPYERLGANDDLQSDGYQSIRRHCFLSAVDSEHIMTASDAVDDDREWDDIIRADPDLRDIDKIAPGLNETQMLRLLTDG